MSSNEVAAVKTTATINLLAGIWLFISPWVYRDYMMHNAWNSWIVGAAVLILSAIRVSSPMHTRSISFVNLLLGIWTFASPWIYHYTTDTGRFINSLCVGVIVFVLGAYGSSVGMGHGQTTAPPPLRP